MLSNLFKGLTPRFLLLAMLALVAVAGAASSSAAPRTGEQADDAQAAATLTVRSSRYGRILFDGRGRALYAFTRDRRGGRSRC